jgi:CubicO group peptidase (beta-lactamase class C family)
VGLVLGGLGAFRMSRRSVRTGSVQAESAPGNAPDDFKAVDDYITARMETARIPGLSVAIVQGDQIVYLRGYGQADASGRIVTPHTPFIIGSISKTFTALALMQVVEAGKVDLDAPLQRYLPYFRVGRPTGRGAHHGPPPAQSHQRPAPESRHLPVDRSGCGGA